jgi:hypothetical protein
MHGRSRPPLSLAWLAAILLGPLSLPPGARAQQPARPAPDPAKLEARETEARRACDSGRTQEGARLLTELLNQTNDGTYIFNLARCYQQNGQLDQALLHFRSYLRRTDVDPAAAARAREYIAVLERPQPAPPAAAASPPVTPRVTAPTSPTKDASPAPPGAPEVSASASGLAGSPGRALRIGGLVAAGAGLASLAVGSYYAVQTRKLNDETERAQRQMDKPSDWFDRQNEKGEQAERRQWLFLGAGATAVVAGGVLYYLGVRAQGAAARQETTTVVLSPLPGGGGAFLSGRF